MSLHYAAPEYHSNGMLPQVLLSQEAAQATDKNEPATSYNTASTQGVSFGCSRFTSPAASYDQERSYMVEVLGANEVVTPVAGYQERDVESGLKFLKRQDEHMTVEERNLLCREVADFICAVPQS